MNLIVDTSVLIAVIAGESQRERLIDLTRGLDLLAPASVQWEIGNAFSAMLKSRRLTLAQALQALEIYRQIPVRFVEVELEDSLVIAAQFNLYAYDAYLVRCALKYNAPLISLDRNLIQAALAADVQVVEVER